jgi:hypothetical protein
LKAFRTEVRLDWGALVYFVHGLLSGWLGPWQSAVAAAAFLFKQAVSLSPAIVCPKPLSN